MTHQTKEYAKFFMNYQPSLTQKILKNYILIKLGISSMYCNEAFFF